VLDEPSSGLDPLVRRDILEAIIRSIADEGRTVLFSSHLLHEVERVADHVALIDQGRVVLDAPLDDLLATHRRWTVRFAEAQVRPPALAGVLSWEGEGHEWTAVYQGEGTDFPATAARHGAQVLDKRIPSLDEIFVARVGTRPVAPAEAKS
jgi:ABC-2 type transport system ATP-binding protein